MNGVCGASGRALELDLWRMGHRTMGWWRFSQTGRTLSPVVVGEA
jgi:hypothetical protein